MSVSMRGVESGSVRSTVRSLAGLRLVFVMLALLGSLLAPSMAHAAPEITVTIGRESLFNTDNVLLGSVKEGKRLVTAITIMNDGTSPLEISNVTIAPPFLITSGPATTIAPKKRTAIRIEVPSSAPSGFQVGDLVIESNDLTENPFTLTLNVDIVPLIPEIALLVGKSPLFDGDNVPFLDTFAGRAVSRSFSIVNTGTANLTVSAPQVDNSAFVVDFRKNVAIRPGGRLPFTIRMPATTAGTFEGTVTIASNDPLGDIAFTVSGNVAASSASLQVLDAGRNVINGGFSSFGNSVIGRPVTKTFTIANRGRQKLTLSPVTPDGLGFTITKQPAASVAPGRSTKFTVRMLATADVLNPSAILRFTTNTPTDPEFEFLVNGSLAAPVPEIDVTQGGTSIADGGAFNFGTTDANVSLVRTFLVRNLGTAPLEVGPLSVTGTGFSLVSPLSVTLLPAGGSTEFSVELRAGAALNAMGMISLGNTDSNESPFDFSLAGTVVVPVPSPEITIQSQVFGQTSTVLNNSTFFYPFAAESVPIDVLFTVRNVGTANLTVGPVMVSGMGYSLVSGQPVSPLVPQAATNFVIRLLSPTVGTRTGSITIPTNDGDENPFVINLFASVASSIRDFRVSAEGVRIFDGGEFPFGTTASGEPLNRLFTVTNVGESPIELGMVSVVGAGFTVVSQPAPVLPFGASTNFVVQMTGAGAGPVTGTVSFSTNVTSQNPFNFAIEGTVYNWFPFANGFDGPVRALVDANLDGAAGNELYAAGSFGTAVGVANTARIARFVGGAWQALPGGPINNGQVNAVALFDPPGTPPLELFVGGSFTDVGTANVAAPHIAAWDGTSWSSLGLGTNGAVRAMTTFTTGGTASLYVAGDFSLVGNSTIVSSIARWTGTGWQALPGGGLGGGTVNALAVWDPDGAGSQPPSLYAGGSFTLAGNVTASGIARWNGEVWSAVGGGITPGVVNALQPFDNDGAGPEARSLIIGGSFLRAGGPGGTIVNNITRLTGNTFFPMRSGTTGPVLALSVFDEDGTSELPARLFVGGAFNSVDPETPVAATNIAKWNGVTWTAVGAGVDGNVLALPPAHINNSNVTAPRMVAGGEFSNAGGMAAARIAMWGIAVP